MTWSGAIRSGILAFAAGVVVALSASAAWAKPRIEMVLATDPHVPMNAGQQWFKLLTDRGVQGLRIRPLEDGDKVAIDVRGAKDSPSYQVLGIVTDRNTLLVPGGQFSLGDAGAISKWLDELSENGVDGVTQKKAAFGLNTKQLSVLHEALARPVGFATKKQPPAEVFSRIKGKLTTQLSIDAAAQQSLAADEPVRDELQDVSCGTALAALLRPAGLVLVPRKVSGRDPELAVVRASLGGGPAGDPPTKAVTESWPVGWPSEKKGVDLVPRLFDQLDAEIDDVPAAEVLEVLQTRLKVPFLFDYNSMVRNRVDPTAVKVSVPGKRSYYNRVLQQVLIKAGLQSELRVDEAGKPLFWITTVKK